MLVVVVKLIVQIGRGFCNSVCGVGERQICRWWYVVRAASGRGAGGTR